MRVGPRRWEPRKAELRLREAANIEAALGQSRGKVFGPGGAAELLNMKPTTLASRIKALGIQREKEIRS